MSVLEFSTCKTTVRMNVYFPERAPCGAYDGYRSKQIRLSPPFKGPKHLKYISI
jgi:hypothetical protein